MIRAIARKLAGLFVLSLLLVGLIGCSDAQAKVPRGVVTQAVMLQAQAAQVELWQQLALPDKGEPDLAVDQVKVNRVRTVKVADDLAYDVHGTYEYRLRYPDKRRLQQSEVPFTVVLKEISETGTWQLLQLDNRVNGDRRPWRWLPLTSG